MYDAMKRHQIQVLKQAGHSSSETAKIAGVSVRSVKRIAQEATVSLNEDPQTLRSCRVGRPSKADGFRKFVTEILEDDPDLPTVELLHRARQSGYEGGKSAFYGLVAELRSNSALPMVRFEGLAGEFSQHDFGQVEVRYADGSRERIHFFASRLKYSRWAEVRLVKNEKVESLVRALLSSFDAWGGVPLVAVFDNTKTVVIKRRELRIEWNRTFGQVALDYRFAPELCAPRRANQKGSVENLVGWVKGSFFKVRRFHDREDLEAQLADWHIEVNTLRPSRATGVAPQERMEAERPRLRPLAIPPLEYPLRFPVVVGPTGTVVHDGASYSVDPHAIGFPGTLYLYPERVRIVTGRHEIEHPRQAEGGKSFLPEHRSQILAKISGKRARLYFKRQQLLELGADVEALLTEIVHRHPRNWPSEVEILFDLLQQFGEVELLQGIRHALTRRRFSSRLVEEIIQGNVA
jgi:transposase